MRKMRYRITEGLNHLICNGLDPCLVTVPKAVHGDTRREVQVLAAGGVVQVGALAVRENHAGGPPIGLDYVPGHAHTQMILRTFPEYDSQVFYAYARGTNRNSAH